MTRASLSRRWSAALVGVILRWPKLVVLLFAAMTVFLGTQTGNLAVLVDDNDVLPASHRYMQTLHRIERIFGTHTAFVILVRPRDNADLAAAVAAVSGISAALAQMQNVVRHNLLSIAAGKIKDIDGSSGDMVVRAFLDRAASPADRDAILAALARNPVYRDILVSQDGRTFGIAAEVKPDRRGYRPLVDDVMTAVAPFMGDDVEIIVGGQPTFLAESERLSDRIAWLFPIALVLIALVHYEAFRSPQAMILPLVTGVIAVVWALGLMGLAAVPLDPFNAITPIMILAVGAGHAVQILKRYFERYSDARRRGEDPARAQTAAITESYISVMPAAWAACLIAIASFLSLTAFDIEAIRRFGLFAAFGIGAVLAIETALIPAIRALLMPPNPERIVAVDTNGWWARMAGHIRTIVLRRPDLVLVATILIATLAAGGVVRLEVENSLESYFAAATAVRGADRTINEALAGTDMVSVLIEASADGGVMDPRVLDTIDRIQAAIDKVAGVGKTISLLDYLKRLDRAINGDVPEVGAVPQSAEQAAQYLMLYGLSADPQDFSTVVDANHRATVINVFLKDPSSSVIRRIESVALEIVGAAMPAGVTVSIGGPSASTAALADVIVSGKLANVSVIAVVVFAVSALYFRSLTAGVLVVMPLGLAVLMVFGTLGLVGVPLNIPTATIAALCIGIGADYAVYLLSRIREEVSRGGNAREAVAAAHATAGTAIMFVASAVTVGFMTLLLSQAFLVHVWMGSVVGLAMVSAAAATLGPMTALVVVLKPQFLGWPSTSCPENRS